MKFFQFSIVQLSLALSIGVILQKYFPVSFSFISINITLIIVYAILYFIQLKYFKLKTSLHLFALITFVTLGYSIAQIKTPTFTKNHYIHFLKEEKNTPIIAEIEEVLKAYTYTQPYIIKIKQIDNRLVTGKIKLDVYKDSLTNKWAVGDLIYIYGSINPIDPPKNPGQFNYQEFLKNREVLDQIKVSQSQIKYLKSSRYSLMALAYKFRAHIIEKLEKTNLGLQEIAITKALLLGDKSSIDTNLRQDYANAGALHILAVSGLHVGIILWLFSGLLKPLAQIKHGNKIKTIILLIILWFFAFIAGLSPSVTRAVCMFSAFVIANSLYRTTNSFNTLFVSFFILIVIHPQWLFEVGFQLSYLAVFFILWLQPKISKWYIPKNKITKIYWDVFTVTMAAQIGVAPLSIYYFNQFPGLFFLTNLVVLPLLGFILAFGILILFLSTLEILPPIIETTYNYLIYFLNGFIKWVSNQTFFVIDHLYSSVWFFIVLYVIIITFFYSVFNNSKRSFLYTLIFCIIAMGILFVEKINTEEGLVVFHKSKTTLISAFNRDRVEIFSSEPNIKDKDYPLKDFLKDKKGNITIYNNIPKVFKHLDQIYIVVDSTGVIPKKMEAIWILTESPKINLHNITDSLLPKLIIADGSNFKSYVNRWKNSCDEKNIAFYYTGEGAWQNSIKKFP